MNSKKITQKELIFSYYKRRPGLDIPHSEVVDWAVKEFNQQTGKVFRDPDRAIRILYQEGLLVKVGKGSYRYEPQSVRNNPIRDFNASLKKQILERDGYRCTMCGKGERDGIELHVDHVKPKSQGGEASLENRQTLCSMHNMFKKNYSQTESGKRYFLRLLALAKKTKDTKQINFIEDVLETYEKHGVNGHIKWK